MTAVVFIGFVAVKVMVFPLMDADRPEGREDVTELWLQYSIAIRQATLIGLAGPVPFQGKRGICKASEGIVLRHIRYNFVVSCQSWGGLPGGMAIAGIRIVHVLVQKIPHIVLGGGNATVQFFGGGFIVGHQPLKSRRPVTTSQINA